MIVIVEPSCIGYEHAPFNAAIIEIASILASDSEIIFYGENAHIEAVKQVLAERAPAQISWRAICPPKRHLKNYTERFLIEFRLFRRILASSKNCNLLIVTSALETSLPALKLQCLLSRFKPRINVFFHAGLSQFLYSKKRQKILSVATPKNMAYIVLGTYIKASVLKIVPNISNRIFAIDHPYIFETTKTDKTRLGRTPIFGFIGLANKAKGFDIFLKIIESQARENPQLNSNQFKLVGKVADDCELIFEHFTRTESSKFLDYPTKREKLPLDTYRNDIQTLDYFVMPYDEHSYEFVCSGAAMDAIYFAKPIIALKSPYFSYLFNICGDIGYLCDDLDHMKYVVSQLINVNDPDRYEIQRSNLVSARANFSSTTVSKAIAFINAQN